MSFNTLLYFIPRFKTTCVVVCDQNQVVYLFYSFSWFPNFKINIEGGYLLYKNCNSIRVSLSLQILTLEIYSVFFSSWIHCFVGKMRQKLYRYSWLQNVVKQCKEKNQNCTMFSMNLIYLIQIMTNLGTKGL